MITGSVEAPLAAPDSDVFKNLGAASGAPTNQNLDRARQTVPLHTTNNHASTLGNIVRAFKSISAIEVNRILDRHERPLWQRNYYERIVRDEHEMNAICEYIRNNPSQWAEDDENPDHS